MKSCSVTLIPCVTKQEGASEADLGILPRYRFRMNDEEKPSVGAGTMFPLETNSAYLATERILLPEDAVCLCFQILVS